MWFGPARKARWWEEEMWGLGRPVAGWGWGQDVSHVTLKWSIKLVNRLKQCDIHTGSCTCIFILYILGPTARWCPMSPHFLTRSVSRLMGLAQVPGLPPVLVSIAFFPPPSISRCFSIYSSPAIGFHSFFFFMTDISARIRSILHLLTF